MLIDLIPGGCDYDECPRLATARRSAVRLCTTHAAEYDRDHDDTLPARYGGDLGPTQAHHCDFDECDARGTEQRGPMRYCPQHASEHDTLVAEAHAAEADAQRAAHAQDAQCLADAAHTQRLEREARLEDEARDYRTAYYNLVEAVRAAIADESLDGLARLVAEDC